MTLSSGTRIGAYEIAGAIGAGGMGEVYRARDTKLGRDVAIKVLPEAFARDAERMARFEREAKVLASLDHPNIAAIYGVEDSGATHALIMQLAEGPTLAERIAAGPIPVDEALRIARQMADALEYAHEHGVVHRDLKPANIKISREDVVKILDFGLAKAIEGDASSFDPGNSPTLSRLATQAGIILGTAAYMSPEQAKAKPVDRRADIWAFGCVLYEMLTGKQPFRGESVIDTLAAVTKEQPDWSLLPAATPTRMRVLLQRCLQKDPKQRLQAIGDARISLDEVLSGAPEPTSSAVTAAAAIPAPVWRRGLPWVLFGAAAIAAAIFAWAYHQVAHAPVPVANAVRFQIPITSTLAPGGGRFAISPDGRLLAFAATGSDGVSRLWVRPLDSLEARSLPGTEASIFLPFFWSPDSRYIAFGADGKLKTVDVASGTVEILCGAPGLVVGGSWNRDGTIIFGSAPGGIMKVSASGGTATPLTALDPSRQEIYHGMPYFLPDGQHFVYWRVSSKAGNSGVFVGSIDTKPGEQDLTPLMVGDSSAAYVPPSDLGLGHLLFMRNGSLMAQPFDARTLKLSGEPVAVAENVGAFNGAGFFSASNGGILVYRTASGTAASQLTWFNRQGKVLGTAGELGNYIEPALSPDGTEAAYVQSRPAASDVWLLDFTRDTSTRLTFSSDAEDPIWSADGKRVIFDSSPSGTFDLYQKPANGAAGQELLLKSSEYKYPTDVSRDGRYLLYSSADPKTALDIWVLPLQGDRKPFPFLSTNFNESDAHFSPDGHWVAYSSDESGSTEVYVRPFSPDSNATDASGAGAKWQVSYSGGDAPQWSADGKELYYVASDWKVMEVDVTTSPTFQAGTPKLLFQVPPQPDITNGVYTIDGKKFLFLAPTDKTGEAQSPFTVVLNWQDILRPTAQN